MTDIKAYLQLPGNWWSAVIDDAEDVGKVLGTVGVAPGSGTAHRLSTLLRSRPGAVRSEIWLGDPPPSAMALSWFRTREAASASVDAGVGTALDNDHGLVVERRVRDLGSIGAGAVYLIDRGDGADTLVLDAVVVHEQGLSTDLTRFDLVVAMMEWATPT